MDIFYSTSKLKCLFHIVYPKQIISLLPAIFSRHDKATAFVCVFEKRRKTRPSIHASIHPSIGEADFSYLN